MCLLFTFEFTVKEAKFNLKYLLFYRNYIKKNAIEIKEKFLN